MLFLKEVGNLNQKQLSRLIDMLSVQPQIRPRLSIGLIRMGGVSGTAVRVIAANIQALLGLPVEMLAPMEVPGDAFQAQRSQYDAGLILGHLARCPFPDSQRILCVTDADLCAPIFTYVFGEAEFGRKLAVISDYRIKCAPEGTPEDLGVYYERLTKVALHEIAHTFSVYHCERPECLMQISPRVSDLDGVEINFCERCGFALYRAIRDLAGNPTG